MTKRCSNCNTLNDNNSQFCRACGTQLAMSSYANQAFNPQTPNQSQYGGYNQNMANNQQKSSNDWIIILVVVIIVVLIIAISAIAAFVLYLV